MATIETAVRKRIISDVTLASLVGERVYPLVAPEGAVYPLVVYQIISSSRITAHFEEGKDSGATGLIRNRFQFTVVGKTYDDVSEVAEALKSLWDAWKGDIVVDGDTVAVQHSFVDNEAGEYGQSGENKSIRIDVFIMYLKEI